MSEPEKSKKEIIISLLKEAKIGLNFKDLTKKTGYHYITISPIIAELKGAGLVSIVIIGRSSYIYWKEDKVSDVENE